MSRWLTDRDACQSQTALKCARLRSLESRSTAARDLATENLRKRKQEEKGNYDFCRLTIRFGESRLAGLDVFEVSSTWQVDVMSLKDCKDWQSLASSRRVAASDSRPRRGESANDNTTRA